MSHVHQALRRLFRKPGFMLLVTLMLAVGIGGTTAMFSIFQQVLLSKLPVDEPEELVNLGAPGPKQGTTTCTMAGDCEQVFSYAMFRDLEARQTVLSELAGHYATFANLAYRNQTLSARALLVSGQYFPALRIRPALGRMLGPQDEPGVGESAVAVLSYAYWQSSLGADPDVVGRPIVVNGQTLTIVGVAPDGFLGTTGGWNPSLFVPLSMRWRMESNAPRSDGDRRTYWVYAFGRLKPGVSIEEARASLDTLYSGILNEVDAPLNTAMPPEMLEKFRARHLTVEPGPRGQSLLQSGAAAPPFAMLLAVAGVVLAIVCFNVANLMLARGAARTAEMAIRTSLGASRTRLVGELLLESLALALLGGIVAIPVAAGTLRGLSALVPWQIADAVRIELSTPAIGFAGAISLATVLLFGLLPALRSSAVQPAAAMKGHARQAGGHGRDRLGRSLATIQIVFSMLLLVFAGLFTKSLANLAREDLGMNVDSLVTFNVSPGRNGYANSQAAQLFDTLERELAAQPGVTGVTSSMVPLIAFSNWDRNVTVEGTDPGPAADKKANWNEVGAEFFRTLSIPLLAGRTFTDADAAGAPRVAVINEAFVRKFRLEDGAVGRRVSIYDGAPPNVEIVGVIADAKYSAVKAEAPPQLIVPRRQDESLGTLSFYVRGAAGPDALMATIRRVVAAADPSLPVSDLMTMDRIVDDNLFTDRLIALLAGAFAALATLLAATGLYGVIAHNVARRTRELGLRLALGATAGELRAMVLKQVAMIAAIGMPVGLALGVLLGQGAGSLLYGLNGHDPLVLGGAVAVLGAIVLAAGYLPARRASAVEPMEALREE